MSNNKIFSSLDLNHLITAELANMTPSMGDRYTHDSPHFKVNAIYLEWMEGVKLKGAWFFDGGDLDFLLDAGGPFIRAKFLRWDASQGLIWAELKHRYRQSRLIRELNLITSYEYQVAFRPDQIRSMSSSIAIEETPIYESVVKRAEYLARQRKDLIKTLQHRLPKIWEQIQFALYPEIEIPAWKSRPSSLHDALREAIQQLSFAPGGVYILLGFCSEQESERIHTVLEELNFDLEEEKETAIRFDYETDLKSLNL